MFQKLFRILSVSQDAKTVKGEKYGWLTGIIYMAPSDESGVINVCPHASEGCRAACLFSAGMGKFKNVIKARIERTKWFARDRKGFLAQLDNEITIFKAIAETKGFKAAIRLNGTSDLPYENYGIMDKHSDIQFYDYTKNPNRMMRFLELEFGPNYHLTFSRSESNEQQAKEVARAGGNVAVVFAERPKKFWGRRTIDADSHDLRFLDPKKIICALSPKGSLAKKDNSGFVVQTA